MAKKKKAAKKKTVKKKAAKKAVKRKAGKGTWSTDETKLLKKLFPNTPTAKIAKELRRSLDTVKKKASRMGLRKSKTYMKSLGRK